MKIQEGEGPPLGDRSPEENSGHTDHNNRLLLYILIGIIAGILIGGWLPEIGASIGIVGDIFLNLLMMLVVPLVILSMIVGITSLGNIRKLGAIGWRTILYYMVTTSLSVLVGLIAVNIIKPGKGISSGEDHPDVTYHVSSDNRYKIILDNKNLDQANYNNKYVIILKDQQIQGLIDSVTANSVTVQLWEKRNAEEVFYVTSEDGTQLPFYRRKGEYIAKEPALDSTGTGVQISLAVAETLQGKEESSLGATMREVLIGNEEEGQQGLIPRNLFRAMTQMDILPLIFFALILGAALSVLGEKAKTTLEVITTLNDAVMQLVHWVMLLAPVGIFGLVAARIGEAGGFASFLPELFALGKYTLTVLSGLLFHALITLPLILYFFGKRQPWRYAGGVGPALLNAFSTASSSATLPLTIQGVEEKNKVSNRTAGFVLPLGATINMDGTALYESVAAIFIAQVYGIDLGPAEQIIIFFTATLAAIGAAGIPEAGLVTLVIVLKAVGLPIEGVALILTIDWLLDRFRTTVNVWGDSIGAGVIDVFEQKAPAKA